MELTIGRADVEAFGQKLDDWLKSLTAKEQALMAIITRDASASASEGGTLTLPGFVPDWSKEICVWKLRTLADGRLELAQQDPTIQVQIRQQGSAETIRAAIDLEDIFSDRFSW
jgi:hypothetical protein